MSWRSRIRQSNKAPVGLAFLIVAGLCCATFTASQESPCVVGTVESLGLGVSSPFFDGSPTVSADERVLFLTSNRASEDIFVSTREEVAGIRRLSPCKYLWLRGVQPAVLAAV
jgi:hypothetical protein